VVLRSAVYPMQWIDIDDGICGMAVQRMGMLAGSVRKTKALKMKMETVTLSGTGRWNLTFFVVISV